MQIFPMTITAIVSGIEVAKCPEAEIIDLGGQIYFPEKSIDWSYLRPNRKALTCVWKGNGEYYDFCHDGEQIANVAWRYSQPKDSLIHLKRYLSFDRKFTTLEKSRALFLVAKKLAPSIT